MNIDWLLKYFRPHIIEYEGNFYVRRRVNWFFWEHLTATGQYSWYSDIHIMHCRFTSEEKAYEAYQNYKDYKRKLEIIAKLSVNKIKRIL